MSKEHIIMKARYQRNADTFFVHTKCERAT